MRYLLTCPQQPIRSETQLEGSKSISNRLLIIRALSGSAAAIENLSPSDDTSALLRLLSSNETICDVGAAGTTMRFLTAYFSITEGERILTGSDRMKNRPIGELVNALQELGAAITYLEKEGFPPLKIKGKKLPGGKIKIRADISSQYISALLMIAPGLQEGLELELSGKISSRPYIEMTLQLMQESGAQYTWSDNKITIYPGKYSANSLMSESDWSAASYYFSICALQKNSEIRIKGLFEKSLQGDSILPEIYKNISVSSAFENDCFVLKNNGTFTPSFSFDFTNCPDLAQTVIVSCSALGISGNFTGLESLRIKETDRTAALANELKKFGVDFYEEGNAWKLSGKINSDSVQSIQTYEDHRMAMCFAPLSVVQGKIIIEDPAVVNKSYPAFWRDLEKCGFSIAELP